MTAYREPDQTARVEELEAECERLRSENVQLRVRRARRAALKDWWSENGVPVLIMTTVLGAFGVFIYASWRGSLPTSTPTTIADGRRGAAVSCQEPADCTVLAGKTCDKGYEVVEGAAKDHRMLIACREAK